MRVLLRRLEQRNAEFEFQEGIDGLTAGVENINSELRELRFAYEQLIKPHPSGLLTTKCLSCSQLTTMPPAAVEALQATPHGQRHDQVLMTDSSHVFAAAAVQGGPSGRFTTIPPPLGKGALAHVPDRHTYFLNLSFQAFSK